MKKVVLALAVVFSVALVSCSNKEAKTADSESVAADTTEVVAPVEDSNNIVDSNNVDSPKADSVVK